MLINSVRAFTLIACAISLVGGVAQARPLPLRSVSSFARYTFDGQPYDRVLSVLARPRSWPRPATAAVPAVSPAGPYTITDLAPFALAVQERVQSSNDPPRGVYIPTGVSNTGHIAVVVPCICFIGYDEEEYDGGFSTVFDASGNVYDTMTPFISSYSAGTETVYAVNDVGAEAGQWYEHDDGPVSGNIGWTDNGSADYYDGAHGGNTALALNDFGIAVGRDYTPTGVFAATFSYTHHRIDLPSIKNLSCVGARAPMATGISDSGKIVGYACDRAVVFSQIGYAQVLPVGAAGVSTSAQAVNQHGDVVGSAGSEAFLYRGHVRTYLPRPAGETAGNAVAYAINASDEIVGDIVTGGGTTAFLYVNGRSYDLNSLLASNSAWLITHAAGINDGGQIVGEGTFAGNTTDGFSMVPSAAAVSREMQR
jgi:hypothetical protein